MPIISAFMMALLSPLLAVVYLIIRIIIEIRLRRRRNPLHVRFKYSTRASRRRFSELLEESIFAVRNKGVTIE
jgi:hypothetical protein